MASASRPPTRVLDPAGGDPNRANGNVYINAGEDLSDNGITATVALQNTVDQNNDAITNGRAAGADANPEFSGEIAAAMCQPGTVNCAPPGHGQHQPPGREPAAEQRCAHRRHQPQAVLRLRRLTAAHIRRPRTATGGWRRAHNEAVSLTVAPGVLPRRV